MIKRLFSSLTMLAVALSMNAQTLQLDPAANKRLLVAQQQTPASVAKVEPTANQMWYGYYDGKSSRSGLGVKSAETYDQASYFVKAGLLEGKKIVGMRIYLRDKAAYKDLKIWLSPVSLPKDVNSSATFQEVNIDDCICGDESENQNNPLLGIANDILFNTPYVVDENFYAGYTYTVPSISTEAGQYPIVTAIGDYDKTLYLRTSVSVPDWGDFANAGYGRLAIQLLVEGDFAANSVSAQFKNDMVASVNGECTAVLTFSNDGSAAVKDIDYTITRNTETGAEQHIAVTPEMDPFTGGYTMKIPMQGASTLGSETITFNITKVNGVANESAAPAATAQLITLSKVPTRGVVVEEFTGTGCGWCPRGLVGMAIMRETFGDQFIGIALHKYNSSDPMYPSNYASISFSGAPSCRLNRATGDIDPKYGSENDVCDDVRAQLEIPTMIDLSITAAYNADFTGIDIKATVEAVNDVEGKYSIAYALIADGLSGTTSSWKQSNYYYQYTASYVGDPDMAIFCSGGSLGSSKVFYDFDDVLINSSYNTIGANLAPALPTLTVNTPVTTEYSLTLPTSSMLKTPVEMAGSLGKIAAVAFVIAPDGTITNARKLYLPAALELGVTNLVNNEQAKEVARYNAAGQLISAPQKGLNIIKMSDGTTIKMMEK